VAVGWGSGGAVAVVGTADGQGALWDTATGGLIAPIPAHPPRPLALAGAPRLALAGGAHRQAQPWPVRSAALVAALPHPEGLRGLAIARSGAFLTLDGAGAARVWDLPDGPERYAFGPGKEPLSRLALTPDARIAFAIVGGESARASRWSMADGGVT